jgi:hypothetical protein
MAVSNEFIEAVNRRDILGIRLMLKNSLLLDTSFYKYSEMIRYVEKAGISIWMEPKDLERKEKPWSVDLMNYELTAIMNDFSQVHMEYLKEIISYVYGSSGQKSQNELSISRGKNLVGDGCLEYSNRMDISKTFTEKGKSLASGVKQAVDNQIELHDVREKKRQVIIKLSNMTKLLRNARVDKEVKLSSNDIDNIAWDNQLLEEIKTEALDIVSICRYLEGGQ